jgi:ribosome-associated protein
MVSAQTHRSQSANRQLAEERLVELLREALVEEAERRPTRPSKGARRRRLKAKRRRSELKRQRGPVEWER